MENEQRAYQIDRQDNVATALFPLLPGMVTLVGDARDREVALCDAISAGHKLSVLDIAKGQAVVKYGIPIGLATKDIKKGSWVHLHNIHSAYDERSSHLDPVTGAPKDISYE